MTRADAYRLFERVSPPAWGRRRVSAAGYGNVRPGLIMYLEGMGISEVEAMESPTAAPVTATRRGVRGEGLTRRAA